MIDLETLVPMPSPHGLKWRRKNTDSSGVYFEDPRKFGINMDHPEYEWSPIFTAAQMAAMREQVAREVAQACYDMCDCPGDAETIKAEFGLAAIGGGE